MKYALVIVFVLCLVFVFALAFKAMETGKPQIEAVILSGLALILSGVLAGAALLK